MSIVAIQGGATGTGTVTVVAPSTSINRTITLPDITGTVATAESTLAQFNATGSAPVYACRAWVNFNGTGTVAILSSGNVSYITDNGTGDYTVNFSTAMPDANYALQGATTQGNAGVVFGSASSSGGAAPTLKTTAAIRLTARSTGGTLLDVYDACVSFFR